MKKTTLSIFALLIALFQVTDLKAQPIFTADLELFFRDTARHFVLEAGDSLDLGFSVANHGPDDIDTSEFVLFGMTGIPPQYFLIIQTDTGLIPIANGDTIHSRGMRFLNDGSLTEDITEDVCFYLRTNEDPGEFIYDPNQNNDTICFTLVWKAGDTTTSIRNLEKNATLKISPNPAREYVDVPVKDMKGQDVQVFISGIDGRSVYTAKITNSNSGTHRLSVASWPQGIYVVTVQTDKVRRTGRFVVR